MNPFLVVLAILPALLICFIIYKIDRYDKESYWQLILCFILGMLVTFPAMKIEEYFENMGLDASGQLWELLILSFLVVGVVEELAKFLILMGYAYPKREFNEPLDGIVYSVIIAMGFATLENVIYANRFGLETTILRAFTAVPAHATFAIFMGYYVGLAKFKTTKTIPLISVGLFSAATIHGLYDFFILQEYYDWLMVFATLTLCISLYFAIRLIKIHQINSPFKEDFSFPKKTKTVIEDAEIITGDFSDAIIDDMNKDNQQQ